MPITVSCSCQNPYRVKDELAGKKIKCPFCHEAVDVPLFDPGMYQEDPDPFEADYDSSPATWDYERPGGSFESRSRRESVDSAPDRESSAGWQATSSEYSHPPVGRQSVDGGNRQSAPEGHQPVSTNAGPRRVNAGSVMAGLGMMVGAAIWFVVIIAAGRFDLYPPILFIVGLVSFVKGLLGAE